LIRSALSQRLADRLAAVEDRLEQACRRSGRSRAEVALLAVTKTVAPEVAALLPGLGVLDLAENRPQELWRKAEILPETVRWHLIGHLQRNKIERTLPLVHCIHSVDSLRLLSALEEQGRPLDVLLEVNASGEQAKQGFSPEEVPCLADRIASLRQVRVRGLMTMAAYDQTPECCRPTFLLLRTLRDRLQLELGAQTRLEHLSMGMSNDFEVAVEEGATLVRLGTVLFGGLSSGE
jgi:PLP dependent protein